MTYQEIEMDLFEMGNDCYFAHCISADFALGAGIAKEFVKKYDMKKKLIATGRQSHSLTISKGDCILIGNVFNLVTKARFFHKPTYDTLADALVEMRTLCVFNDVKRLAMPLIGCGLDKLSWSRVSTMIQDIFKDMDIEIIICIK